MGLLEELSMPQILSLQWLMNISRYFIVVGGSYLLFWKYLKNKFNFIVHKPSAHKKKIFAVKFYTLFRP
jgi:hypothetical protein